MVGSHHNMRNSIKGLQNQGRREPLLQRCHVRPRYFGQYQVLSTKLLSVASLTVLMLNTGCVLNSLCSNYLLCRYLFESHFQTTSLKSCNCLLFCIQYLIFSKLNHIKFCLLKQNSILMQLKPIDILNLRKWHTEYCNELTRVAHE